MNKTLLLGALALQLAGCTYVAPLQIKDKSVLEECEPITPITGTDGKAFIKWAELNGPKVVKCQQNHNALTKIVKSHMETN